MSELEGAMLCLVFSVRCPSSFVSIAATLRPFVRHTHTHCCARLGILYENGAQRPERCYWFLFTDFMVYTERLKEDSFRIKALLPIKGLKIQDVADKEGIHACLSVCLSVCLALISFAVFIDQRNRFTISSNDSLYAVYTDEPEQKRAWVDDIKKLGTSLSSLSLSLFLSFSLSLSLFLSFSLSLFLSLSPSFPFLSLFVCVLHCCLSVSSLLCVVCVSVCLCVCV